MKQNILILVGILCILQILAGMCLMGYAAVLGFCLGEWTHAALAYLCAYAAIHSANTVGEKVVDELEAAQ